MSVLLSLLLTSSSGAAPSTAASEEGAVQGPSGDVGKALKRGVLRGQMFDGWRRELVDEAMQEAWCLVCEHHPEALSLTAPQLQEVTVAVPRRNGRVVEQSLDTRLFELGAIARNTVLRDNHLNRQSSGRIVRFAPVDEEAGYQLRPLGQRKAPQTTEG